MNKFISDSSTENIHDNLCEGIDMNSQDTVFHNFLLRSHRSSLDQSRKSLSWNLSQQILQEQHHSLRNKLLLAIRNPIVSSLDPIHSLLLETGFRRRTQDFIALAYHEAMQQIQDQDHVFLTQLRRRTNTVAIPFVAQSLQTVPLEIDIQQCTELDKDVRSSRDSNANIRNQRDPTHSFPCRLHEILSNPDYSECITWLPHGRAWKILRRTQFERIVIPNHFRHGRYSSFMRQVNGWGFQRITEGPDHNAYFHPRFIKDSAELCWTMRRPTSSDTCRTQISVSDCNFLC